MRWKPLGVQEKSLFIDCCDCHGSFLLRDHDRDHEVLLDQAAIQSDPDRIEIPVGLFPAVTKVCLTSQWTHVTVEKKLENK